MTKHDENSSLDPRLERLLADCLEAEERGEPLDESALLRSHPEFANELASFFDNRRAIGRLAERLCAQELSTAGIDALHDKSANDSLVGRTFGDYELTREVARGGMGVVYAARHRTLQRTVALKMILAGRAASSVDLARFRQEAEAAARLDHPHIVPVYEVGEHDGFCYFTMKLLDGGNLHRHLDSLKGNARRAGCWRASSRGAKCRVGAQSGRRARVVRRVEPLDGHFPSANLGDGVDFRRRAVSS